MNEIPTIEIRLAANQFINEKKYWLAELSGELNFSSFPGNTEKKEQMNDRAVLSFRMEGKLFERLMQISDEGDPNLHIILSAALIALLERYTANRDIIIGTSIDRQESPGNLSNTILPLRIPLNDNITFKQLIIKVKEKIEQAIENQNYPIEHLVYQDLRMKKPAKGFALFDVGLILKNLQEKKYIEHLQLNMLFTFFKTSGYLECEVDYNSSDYPRVTIEQIGTHFRQFLETAAFYVDCEIMEIEILSETEKHWLLHEFNQSILTYPDNKTIHMLFEDRAASGPDCTAIIHKDEHFSYKNTNENANRLARVLINRGIHAGQPVGILLDRSPLMVECILAVWKAGGAYIPMDTQYPFPRMQDMINNSQMKVILSLGKHITPSLQNAYADLILKLEICKETLAQQKQGNLNVEINMKDLAYIIYTSGSTGKPKGAMIEHRGMLNHIYAKIDALQITGNSILAQNASHTFDVSVWQFFIALTQGGRTVIFAIDQIFDVGLFIKGVVSCQITILEVVPSYLAAMLAGSDSRDVKFKNLAYLLVTGETMPVGLAAKWFEHNPTIKIVNAYGPTEASDDITHFIMDKVPKIAGIPIGKPIPNMQIYILNERMQLCPIGVKGEICVAGIGVGRGYINDDERTRQVFSEDPFAPGKGIRLYKTGDIGCLGADGNIDFLGRKDYQVKIRGFRIELGEIENTLNCFPGIEQTTVVDKTYPDGNKYLCAYFVSSSGANIPDMKAYLAERLPYYMIPAHFISLKELPLTANGKIDRETLQNLELAREAPLDLINEETLKRFVSPAYSQVNKPAITEQVQVALSDEECRQILTVFNNTRADYAKHETVHRVFEIQVEKTPDSTALKYEHKHMTYLELNKRSNVLAGALKTHGVKAGNIVGLMVGRSLDMLISLWAILKVGGAYLPIGDENPPERIKFMLKDSCVDIILGDSPERTSEYKKKFLDINRVTYSQTCESNLEPVSTPGDLAYVIYTSGSTGTPKGVMIENRSLINFIKGMTDIIEFNESSIILSLITISFDIFFLETLLPLTNGSRVVIGNKKSQSEAAETGKLLQKENITIFQCTPTMLQRIAADAEAVIGLQQLKYLLVGGEIFREALYEKVQSKISGKIFNLYGPTETTVWSTAKFITGLNSLNIGKPIANTKIYIMNEKDELCPIGISGELCISGDGVSRGYLNNPELTCKKFDQDLWDEKDDQDKKKNEDYQKFFRGSRGAIFQKSPPCCHKFYKTGDLARWLANGDIEFLGRQDQQIKINGIRIELTEIENILLRHTQIDEAVVVSKETKPGTSILCAFLVSQKPIWESEIRTYLANNVPAYMIPAQFVHLEKIPLNPSGKIDRKLLAAVDITAHHIYTEPRNEAEQKIKKIWETNLGIENIGIKDNFFSIGGDSIKSMGLINALNREFSANLKIRDLFQNETIEKLAIKIAKPGTMPAAAAQYDQALQELATIKDKFMKRKLKK